MRGEERDTGDKDKAKLLLGIIKEVCDDVEGITKDQLSGLAQPKQIKAAAIRLYQGMSGYASQGDVSNMYRYYQNCINSEVSKWDWLLERIGKKSLKSQWERFQEIYHSKKS